MLKKLLPKLNVFTRTSDQSNRRIKWSYQSKAKCKVLKHFQTILIIHGFLMCKHTYSLKCICNLRINTHGAPVITHRPALSSPSYGPHTGNVSFQQSMKCHISSFFVLFVGDFATESGSRHSAERYCSQVQKHQGALWRKDLCQMSFVQAWVTALVAKSPMSVNQQQIK